MLSFPSSVAGDLRKSNQAGSVDISVREKLVAEPTYRWSTLRGGQVTANEVRFAKSREEQFRLYRLFNFRSKPQLFDLAGAIDRHCKLDPTTYKASF